MNTSAFAVTGPGQFHIRTFDTAQTGGWRDKKQAEEQLRRNVKRMAALQDRFYAQDREALLLIFQAMDSAGKDGAIKHVMSGPEPAGGTGQQLQAAVRRGSRARLPLAGQSPSARNAAISGSLTVLITKRYSSPRGAMICRLPKSCPHVVSTTACGNAATASCGTTSVT